MIRFAVYFFALLGLCLFLITTFPENSYIVGVVFLILFIFISYHYELNCEQIILKRIKKENAKLKQDLKLALKKSQLNILYYEVLFGFNRINYKIAESEITEEYIRVKYFTGDINTTSDFYFLNIHVLDDSKVSVKIYDKNDELFDFEYKITQNIDYKILLKTIKTQLKVYMEN